MVKKAVLSIWNCYCYLGRDWFRGLIGFNKCSGLVGYSIRLLIRSRLRLYSNKANNSLIFPNEAPLITIIFLGCYLISFPMYLEI